MMLLVRPEVPHGKRPFQNPSRCLSYVNEKLSTQVARRASRSPSMKSCSIWTRARSNFQRTVPGRSRPCQARATCKARAGVKPKLALAQSSRTFATNQGDPERERNDQATKIQSRLKRPRKSTVGPGGWVPFPATLCCRALLLLFRSPSYLLNCANRLLRRSTAEGGPITPSVDEQDQLHLHSSGLLLPSTCSDTSHVEALAGILVGFFASFGSDSRLQVQSSFVSFERRSSVRSTRTLGHTDPNCWHRVGR